MPQQPKPNGRFSTRPTFWIGVGGIALLAIIGVVSSGIGGLIVMAALAAMLTGFYSLVTGRKGWAAIANRKVAGIVTIAALVAAGVGGSLVPPSPSTQDAGSVRSAASGSRSPSTPSPTPSFSFSAESAPDPATVTEPAEAASVAIADSSTTDTTATALLATLPIKGKAPMTGYVRTAMFGAAWIDEDRNGCDTRNDILSRDLTSVQKEGSCRVVRGELTSPYTGQVIHFVRGQLTSTAVQIDHIVSLGDAWQTGAQQLSQAQRVALANDPINLFAVDGRSNEQKSDGDTATWLPAAKAFRCTYVGHQVSVKATYGLWVTQAEHDAMLRVLSDCRDARAVSSPFAPAPPVIAPAPAAPAPAPAVVAPVPAPPVKAAAPVAPAPAPAAVSGCSPNYSGQCVPIVSDVDCAGGGGNGPAYLTGTVTVIGTDVYQLDRDHDGIGCE
ncbi:MAG: hypothetical protein QOI70_964 [Microbacteriaceae bacterium]|nr:hypothetical protein [Microbacteriaceae bacterium]